MTYTPQVEKELERQTREFLIQCEREGKITKGELAEISLARDASGSTPPQIFTTYKNFVRESARIARWPLRDIARSLHRRQQQLKFSKRDIEIYINFPAWTQQELGCRFGLDRSVVSRILERVRRILPALRLDATRNWGVPKMRDMKRIETTSNSDDRLNGSEVLRF